MTKKSRKSRVKHNKPRQSRQSVATKATDQHRQPLPTVVKQAPVAKSLITGTGLADRYRYVLSDARRSLIIGGSFILLLIVLSFFLR